MVRAQFSGRTTREIVSAVQSQSEGSPTRIIRVLEEFNQDIPNEPWALELRLAMGNVINLIQRHMDDLQKG